MGFIKEIGFILLEDDQIISCFDGSAGHVDFPFEMIWKIHQMSPGYIGRLVHTHPPGMRELSQRDEKMMKALALAMHPFPVRMSVITYEFHRLQEYIYLGVLEPKEVWQQHKDNDRKFEITLEDVQWIQKKAPSWFTNNINKSYR